MNTITFVYLCISLEKNDDCVFSWFHLRFLPLQIKKQKNITRFFTISFKITLSSEKRIETFTESSMKKEWKLPIKIESKPLWNRISSVAISHFFLPWEFLSIFLVLHFGLNLLLDSFCLYLLVRRKRSCPIVFF